MYATGLCLCWGPISLRGKRTWWWWWWWWYLTNFSCKIATCTCTLKTNSLELEWLCCWCYIYNSKDISDITSTVTQYLWLAKAIKSKEMTENLGTSNDCRFTYMLDCILKPGGKLEYQDNASLSKFKGNPSIDTCQKLRWKFVCE